jgi:TonB family protein
MSWWHYLLMVNFYLVLFFGFYTLLLRNETFFQLNRIYLIAACLLSFIIPAIQLNWVQNLFITQHLQQKIISYTNPDVIITDTAAVGPVFNWLQIAFIIYIAGCFIMILKLVWQLLALKRIINNPSPSAAYAFFRKINIGSSLSNNDIIADHEQVHAQQWHSADVLLIEIIAIINWFNPIVYLYRSAIKHIHEFIADGHIIQSGTNKSDYALLLVGETFGIPSHNLTTSFYNHSLLKKRIIMIQKNRSQRTALLKYGLTAPLFVLMLVLSSATVSSYQQGPLAPPQPRISKIQKNGVYNATEVMPKFPGGAHALYKFLGKNIKYPTADRENNIQGKVVVQFIVEPNGNLSNIKAVRSPSNAMTNEAVRVISMSPKWMPGKQGGKAVRARYFLPVQFVLSNES